MKRIPLPYLVCNCLFLLVCLNKAHTQLVAKFSATPLSGCAPLLINFTDESEGNPDSWEWDLGNGTRSNFQHPSVTYFNPGTYTVRLIIKKGAQSVTTVKTNYITVHASPVIDFSASAVTGCYPLKVNFTNLSTPGSGTIASYIWDFGDGATHTGEHPEHTYNSPGDYNVSLKAVNSNGCAATATRLQYIRITSGVKANFTMGTHSSCHVPATVAFTNTSTGTGSLHYTWNFGDGAVSTAENPSHTFTTAGDYTIQLIASNGACSDTFRLSNVPIGKAAADFNAPAISCVNERISFNNTSHPNPLNVSWDFGDGTASSDISPGKTYAAPSVYTVNMMADFGFCQDTKTQTIQIIPRPTVDFSAAETNSCKAPFTAVFTSAVSTAAGPVTYAWDFGDGGTSNSAHPSHTYTAEGIYKVTLTITNAAGCTETIEKGGYIIILTPEVLITSPPEKGCIPYSFKPKIKVSSITPIVSYQWDFGDGTTDTGINPEHIYTQTGTYTVTLVYTTSDGCIGTIVKPAFVKVGEKPVVDFIATPLLSCAYNAIQFIDQSTGKNIDEWLWKFGDGGEATQQHPGHVYSDTGYFSIHLTVWDNGCKEEKLIPHYVRILPPIAKFEANINCAKPYYRSFSNTSIVNRSLSPLTWFWDFGDGTTATTEHASHTYAATGTYIVTLTVTNGACYYTTSQTIYIIDDTNTFTVSATEVCPGATVRYDLTLGNKGNIIENIWNLLYDTPSIDSGITTLSQTYTKPFLYTIKVYLTDKNKCVTTYQQQVKVINTKAGLDVPPAACINSLVTFTDTSKFDPAFPIVNRQINYGDGSPEENNPAAFRHTYTSGGSYTIKLKVTGSKGCTDSVSGTIIIADPKAVFTSVDTASCTGSTITFTANYSPNCTYQWDFGDGQTGSGDRPTHQYSGEGVYTVTLNIRHQYGCTDMQTRSNFVQISDPLARFSVNATQSNCPPLIVQFTNQSLNIEKLEWDFGDGTTSTLRDPQHFYTYPGEYWPELKVVSKGGCTNVLKDKKIVIKGPTGTFKYDDHIGCTPVTVNFTGQSPDLVSFIWDFNDGATDATSGSGATYTYTRPGKYLPRMIITNTDGCAVPILGKDSVEVYDVKAGFTTNTQTLCDKGIIYFIDRSVSNDVITHYTWHTDDGITGAGPSFSHEYKTTGDYFTGLEVTTLHNCKSSTGSTFPIKVVSSPEADIRGPAPACVPATFSFSGVLLNSDPYPLTWQWNFDNGQTATGNTPAPIQYTKAGNYSVSLILTNSYACADTVTYLATVHPLPDVDAGNDLVLCRDSPRLLQPSGAVSYTWWPNVQLSCTQCNTPWANPASDITYHVEGKSMFGCKSTDSVRVKVQQRFTVTAAAGDTLCLGEKYRLYADGADQYTWTPAANLNNPGIASPVASPQTTTLYQVVGRDNNNCFTDTAWVPVVVYPYPHVELGEDKTVIVGTSITLTPQLSTDVTRMSWIPGTWLSCTDCPATIASPKQTIQYRLQVSNQGGCMAEDLITLFVVCGGENMFLPNTFSPNGDGTNEVFYPRGKGVAFIKSFLIFNRWGEKVFEQRSFNANDASKGWTGMYKGDKASQDVYVYMIDVVCENGQVLSFKGDVTLLR